MAFAEVVKKIKYPKKTTERYKTLDALDRLRTGTLYDDIPTSFDEGDDPKHEYIMLKDRRPSIVWRGAKMLVDQLSGLMWGDEQMPIIRTYEGEEPSEADQASEKAIQRLVELLLLDATMDEITDTASSGSCAVILRNTDDKELYIEVIAGKECTPKFDPRNPMHLTELEQLYPTTGQLLADMGYEIKDEDLKKDFWFRLTIDEKREVRYEPMTNERYELIGTKDAATGKEIAWEEDAENSWDHGWPEMPVLWIKAPGKGKSPRLDGACLYGAVTDILVGIDYDLSQLQRGYRYTADPLLAIKRGELAATARPAGAQPAPNIAAAQNRGSNGRFSRNAATRILDVEPNGDAKWLEISGQALKAFEELIKTLREWGLEICGGMKSDSETTSGVQSGRALEILYQSLILVVKRWRVALGNKGFLPLVRLVLVALDAGLIEIEGAEEVPTDTTMRLVWPQWIAPQGQDLVALANAAETMVGGSPRVPVPLMPPSFVTRYISAQLGVTDTTSLLKELEQHVKDLDAKQQAQADQEHQNALEKTTVAAKAKAESQPAAPGKGNQAA